VAADFMPPLSGDVKEGPPSCILGYEIGRPWEGIAGYRAHLDGWAGSTESPIRPEIPIMRPKRAVFLLTFGVCVLAAPLAAEAQRAGKISGPSDAIGLVQDRVYRSGPYLVVDALIENRTAEPAGGIEVSVEFYGFFGELVRAEYTVAAPATVGPGQIAALRVVTPHSDAVRRLQYRFTWRQDGRQLQAALKRDIWTIGSPTREASRWP
jgi:hypothetical protein